MYSKKYLIRLDDACPTMNRVKWDRVEKILNRYGVKPMVGVIPHNEDPTQEIDSENSSFGKKIVEWENNGWTIALHGYNHCYTSDKGLEGINPMWSRSEFAGLPLEEQCEKVRKGVAIMRGYGINPHYFFAPSHTFDENTLIALRRESDIRIVSDTIAFNPYKHNDFVFIPQVVGSVRNMSLPGTYTFCYHPNTMQDSSFESLERFIRNNQRQIISFKDLNYDDLRAKNGLDNALSVLFFLYRKMRKLK